MKYLLLLLLLVGCAKNPLIVPKKQMSIVVQTKSNYSYCNIDYTDENNKMQHVDIQITLLSAWKYTGNYPVGTVIKCNCTSKNNSQIFVTDSDGKPLQGSDSGSISYKVN
jgi:hypothetical protein